jgi:hypothetical protein
MLRFAGVSGLLIAGVGPLSISDLLTPPCQLSQGAFVTDLDRLSIESLGSLKVPRVLPAHCKEAQGNGVATICGPPGQFFGLRPVSSFVAQLR